MRPDSRRSGREPGLEDRFALWLARLSKIGRDDHAEAEDERAFYEGFFREKDRRAYRDDPRMRVRRRVLSSFFNRRIDSGARVVDVGCGLGDVLEGLGRSYRRLGLEMARSSARVADHRLGEQVPVLRGSALELPLASRSVDVCLCLEVIEHLREDEEAARELFRVLRPGGWLVASVPYTAYWDDYRRLLGHYRHYTRRSFSDLLEGVGFEVEEHLPNFPDWHQAFTRRYALAQALHTITKPILGQQNVYDMTWPWTDETVVEAMRRRLAPRRRREGDKDYAEAETSTFLAVRKPTSSDGPQRGPGRGP